MTASMKNIVFDSHAILKLTQMESGYKKVKSLLKACQEESIAGFMNQINVGEVYYKTIRAVGKIKAREFLENFQRLPITFVVPDSEMILSAAEIKADFSISYAYCFVLATALRHNAKALTGDPKFKKTEKLVPVEWV